MTVTARALAWDPLEDQYVAGAPTSINFTLTAPPSVSVSISNLHLLNPDPAGLGDTSTTAAVGGTVTVSSGSLDDLNVQVDTNGDGVADDTVQTDAAGNFSYEAENAAPGPVTLEFAHSSGITASGSTCGALGTPFPSPCKRTSRSRR